MGMEAGFGCGTLGELVSEALKLELELEPEPEPESGSMERSRLLTDQTSSGGSQSLRMSVFEAGESMLMKKMMKDNEEGSSVNAVGIEMVVVLVMGCFRSRDYCEWH